MTRYLDNDPTIPTFNVSTVIVDAVCHTWQAIGGEFPEDIPNDEAIEMCLDADRILTFNEGVSGVIADSELQYLYVEHGYQDVMARLAFQVSLN